MVEVTCPQCQTRQSIDPDASGYRCIVCAATWNFVRCTVCGERYHTRPGTRAWTCPNCGTPHGRDRRGISRTGLPIPLLVGALLAIAVVVVLFQVLGGDDAGPGATPTSPTAPARDPLRQACRDLVDVQLFRVQALDQAAQNLTADAAALRDEGEQDLAKAVRRIVKAIRAYQDVANGGGDTQAATQQLLDALDKVDCSTTG